MPIKCIDNYDKQPIFIQYNNLYNMTHRLFTTIIMLLFSILGIAQSKFSIKGRWKIENCNNQVIEIYESEGGLFYGKETFGRMVFEKLKYDSRDGRFIGKMILPDQIFGNDVEIYYESYRRLKLIVRKPLDTHIIYLTQIIL